MSPRSKTRPSRTDIVLVIMLAQRPRCSVYIATSLDGFIARPNGSIDWLSIVQQSGEDYGYGTFFSSVDALIVGRRTYDTVLGFPSWPYAGKRCVVLTHDPPPAQHTESFHTGDVASLLEQLHEEGVRHAYIDGGAVIRSFLDAMVRRRSHDLRCSRDSGKWRAVVPERWRRAAPPPRVESSLRVGLGPDHISVCRPRHRREARFRSACISVLKDERAVPLR